MNYYFQELTVVTYKLQFNSRKMNKTIIDKTKIFLKLKVSFILYL